MIWILYVDYTGNMVTQGYNRKLVNGNAPEENAKGRMQWCGRLLEERHEIK